MRAPPGRCSLGAVTTAQPTSRSSRQPARCWIWRYRSTFRSLLQELETSMQRVKAALAAMPHYHAPDRARRAQGKSKGLILSWHGEGCLADAQEDRRRFRAVHAQCMSPRRHDRTRGSGADGRPRPSAFRAQNRAGLSRLRQGNNAASPGATRKRHAHLLAQKQLEHPGNDATAIQDPTASVAVAHRNAS
jgi:hypothetical protein